ncbi:MAG: DMT family transporter [Hyphomicrobiales bacterium]
MANLDYKKGLIVTALGAIILSFDVPLLKLANVDHATLIFWRTGLTSFVLFVYWLISPRATRPALIAGGHGVAAIIFYCTSNLFFLTALLYTSTANVVFMLALSPLFAALFSYIGMGEKLKKATALTFVICLMGAAIIVWDGLQIGSFKGDLLAICASMNVAMSFTIIRSANRDMSTIPIFGGLILAVGACFFLPANPFTLEFAQLKYLLVLGMIVMPVANLLLIRGPRYISSAEVSMFLLLETVLAPIWVWMVISEEPSTGGLIGGAIILLALATHSTLRLKARRRPAPAL